MIILKSQAQIEAMKEAGRLSAQVLRLAGDMVRPGVSTLEIDEFVETFIRENGGKPAFKGYAGFPASICASVNHEIVHGIPSAKTILQEGDILSIDTGAVVDGWVGDNAWTYAVGRISAEKEHLLKYTEESLWAGIEAACVGNRLGDIGWSVSHVAKKAGLAVVREYVGHGIGRDMHESPNVPNYGRKHSGIALQEGMVLAIEPMLNLGSAKTKAGEDNWVVYTKDGKPSAHFEKTVAITKEGPLLLTVEQDYVRPVSAQKQL